MIRLLFFTLTLLLGTTALFAQNISIGIKSGLNVTSVTTDFEVVKNGQESLNSFHAGLYANMGVSDNFSIQPGLNYNGKGLAFDAGDHSHTIQLHSLDIPIHAIYNVGAGFYVGAGVNIGYYLSGTNSNEGGSHTHTVEYEFDGDLFEYKRWDIGFAALAGYKHDSGIGISVGYIAGLNKVAELPDNTWRSNIIQLSLSYDLFSFKSSE